MSCKFPIYRISEEFLHPSEKRYARNGGFLFGQSELDRFSSIYPKNKIVAVPCGQCMHCRVAKAQEWATRCLHESFLYEHNFFVTLTMDSKLLHFDEYLDLRSHEVKYCSSLDPHLLTKFLKDVREYYRMHYNHIGIRFFACGEYGDLDDLPHFHILFFNLPPCDDFRSFYDKDHFLHYKSDEELSSFWSHGFIDIQPVCFENICYTTRYVCKKLIGHDHSMNNYNNLYPLREKEFIRMSRRPGIGGEYAKRHFYDIYPHDAVVLSNSLRTWFNKPPRYYDKLFEAVNPAEMDIVRGTRSEAGSLANDNLVEELAGLDAASYYARQEASLINKILHRSSKL